MKEQSTVTRILLALVAALLARPLYADTIFLRQSTASQIIDLVPFVDSTDGDTAENALTIPNTDVWISKNGAATVNKNSGGCTVDTNVGEIYHCTLDATDTNTVGRMTIEVHANGALAVYLRAQVLEEAVYDRDFAASATGIIGTSQTGDAYARLGAPAGASVSADLAAIEAETDDIGVAGAGLTAIDLPNQTMNITGNITGNLSGSVGSVTGAVASVTGNVGGNVTGSVGSVTGAVGSVGSAGITEASFATTAGSFKPLGIARQGTAQSATSTTLVMDSSASFADDTAIGMTVVACGSTQGYCQARAVTDSVGSTDTLTVDTWSVTPSGTITYYLFGTAPGGGSGTAQTGDAYAYLTTNMGALGANLTAADDSVMSRLGSPAGASMSADIAAIEAQTDDIGVAGAGLTAIDLPNQTMNITGSITGSLSGSVGSVTGAVGSVTGAVGSVTGNVGGNVTGSVGSLATQAKADVNAEVDSAISDAALATASSLATAKTAIDGIKTVTDALPDSGALTSLATATAVAALPTATENATALLAAQVTLTGTCDSGSTTTCVDSALTQADASQLQDRLICFDDSWCALITTFAPSTDTVTTTKTAPSTRGSKAYVIYPATAQ